MSSSPFMVSKASCLSLELYPNPGRPGVSHSKLQKGMQGHAGNTSNKGFIFSASDLKMLMGLPTIKREEIVWEFNIGPMFSLFVARPWYSLKNFVPAVFKII